MCDDEEISYREIIRLDDPIARYNTGERDFSRFCIKSPDRDTVEEGDFQGVDLSGIILRDSDLSSIRRYLEGAILRDADLSNIDLGEIGRAHV